MSQEKIEYQAETLVLDLVVRHGEDLQVGQGGDGLGEEVDLGMGIEGEGIRTEIQRSIMKWLLTKADETGGKKIKSKAKRT